MSLVVFNPLIYFHWNAATCAVVVPGDHVPHLQTTTQMGVHQLRNEVGRRGQQLLHPVPVTNPLFLVLGGNQKGLTTTADFIPH